MKKSLHIIMLLSIALMQYAQSQTIQERLGYSKYAKLLIVHADDLGVSHSENVASFEGMDSGYMTSASILVPTPWLTEVANYAKENPQADLGIHVCMTSEWADYKWGPVSGEMVPTLVNQLGYFFDNSSAFAEKADVTQVGIEVRSQIEKAIAFGIDPTHLDAHMSCMYQSAELLGEFIKISKEYSLPIATTKENALHVYPDLDTSDFVFIDQKFSANPANYDHGMADFYSKSLQSLKPGLNSITIHAAYENDEMKSIAKGIKYWGANWRQQDFDFFTSKDCKKIIEEENIKLITWREIRDSLIRK